MENPVEHSLAADNLAVGYDQREIIHDLSVRIPTGKITVIVGANACGKSTLLKTLARLLKPSRGSVLLDGKSIQSIDKKTCRTAAGIGTLAAAPHEDMPPRSHGREY